MLLLPVVIYSQSGYQFENYTVDNGLSDNRITCFLKDQIGFIWIGTENGLNRFDGQRFSIYSQDGKRNISNSYVNDIAQDHSGKIWVATQNGLNVIDPDTDSLVVFHTAMGNAKISNKFICSDLIWDIHIDKHNRVWMAPDGKDLCYYDIIKKVFFYFPWKDFIKANFPDRKGRYNSIRRIYIKSDNELWLGTTAGLFSYNMQTGAFVFYKSNESDHFLQLENSNDSNIAYFTQNPSSGLQLLTLKDHKVKTVNWGNIPPSGENRVSVAGMKYMRWLPSGTGELIEINTATGQISFIAHKVDDPRSLPAGVVRTVYTDSSGIVWVGTTTGVGKFCPSLNPFTFMPVFPAIPRKKNPEKDLYPCDNTVHTVFYSKSDHQYYISSPANNCLVIMDKLTSKSRIITAIRGIPLKGCSAIFEDSRGALWILTSTHAFIYNRDNKKFCISSFKPPPGTIIVADMAEDHEGNLWFSCFNGGLFRFSPVTNTCQTMLITKGNKGYKLPTGLYFDQGKNKMWVGTFGLGLFQYNLTNNSTKHLFPEKNAPGFINTTLITDITKDKNDSIVVATHANGLSKCAGTNESAGEFRHIGIPEGLIDNTIYTLQNDLNGDIWASSFMGLTKINSSTNAIGNFSQNSGLLFTDFYSPITTTFDGHMLTGIQNGFLMFHPDSLQKTSSPFLVTITSFETDSLYEYWKPYPGEKIIQPFTSDQAVFSFAALTYFSPGRTRFEYQLEGINKEWVNNANVVNVKYNNLPPGKYRFKVRARDFAGERSSNEATLSFEVLPPWWQTWWARTLVFLILSGLILMIYLRRIRSIKKKVALQYQISSLKERALRAQMNPHFIFNSLNAIQELIVTEQYSASFEYLSKFSKLLRLVLLASENNLLPLSKEIEITRLYIELESLRFKNQFQYNISFSGEVETDNILFPTLLLQPFVENAIWHGLLPKEGLKKLDIKFEEIENSILCTIIDNGIGRHNAQKIKQNKIAPHHSESKGIQMATQRLDILKLTGECSGSITISDVQESNGNTSGTMVEIIVTSNEKIYR